MMIAVDMQPALEEFIAYAKGYSSGDIEVKDVRATLDETHDGDETIRAQLLLSDPRDATWDADSLDHLKLDLARKATELQLPVLSISLIAERERTQTETF